MYVPDEQYVMIEDIKERKKMANGAKHKKTGSKTRVCRFPSDYLTKKERKALDGELNTYSMNKFYTLDEFHDLPLNIQVEWAKHMVETYHVSVGTISTVCFGRSVGMLDNYFRTKGIDIPKCGMVGQKARLWIDRFKELVEQDRGILPDTKPDIPKEPDIKAPIKEVPVDISNGLDSMEIVMRGTINYALLNTIVSNFNKPNPKITIRIEYD